MSQDTTLATLQNRLRETLSARTRLFRRLSIATVVVCLVAVQPALAQESTLCQAENLQGIIEGFFQLTTALGLMGLVVIWQADSLREMFVMGVDKKRGIEQHKRTSLKSAVVLVSLGPLYTVAGSTMGLPLAECINLVPW